jgi:hypothetical protein
MKRYLKVSIVFLVLIAGCEQQKSGPVAEPPTDEATESEESKQKPAKTPTPSTEALYEVAGPEQPVPVKKATEVTLQIRPAEGFKINKRFSWSFDFESAEGLEVETASVGKDAIRLEDSGASIPVKLKAAKPGAHRLVATGDFSVCNDSKCELYRDETVAFDIAASDSN